MITPLLFALLLISCEEEPPAGSGDPTNLIVEVTESETTPGLIEVVAQAENANQYELYVNTGDAPDQTNSTGQFSYTFSNSGYHTIEVRAYGSSGRYLKEERLVVIELDSDVPPEDGYASPLSYEGYELMWNDEFTNATVNENDWNFEIGTGSGG